MPIEVTARHMHATDDLQAYARQKAKEILEDFPVLEHIHVVLDIEKHGKRHIAEVVLQVKRHGTMEATGLSDNLRTSIDLAFEKAQRQVGKLCEKVQDHKPGTKDIESGRGKGV